MDGKAGAPTGRTITYCIVPQDLAAELHDRLRRHFRRDDSVEVIVEQRQAGRRSGSERRAADADGGEDRRLVRNVEGRRVADRRGPAMPVDPPDGLPDAALAHLDRLVFVERVDGGGERVDDEESSRLVLRFQQGDAEALGDLYLRWFDRVYTYLRVVLTDAEQAEDSTQRAFEDVYASLTSYEVRARRSFRAWLFAIVREQAVTALCERGGLDPSGYSAERAARIHLYEGPEFHALDSISDRELVFCIEDLPTQERQVLMLQYMLGLRLRQIASVLECQPDDVQLLQHRAMATLRERLPAVTRARHRPLLSPTR
jgi:RNA polymerase sigma-70 factor (ECF subfamily)